VPRGQTHAIIQSFMAHHQGMILLGWSTLCSLPDATAV
jgi:hypothetical protein